MAILGFTIAGRGKTASIQFMAFDPDVPISPKYRSAREISEAIADFRDQIDFIEKQGKAQLALAKRRRGRRKSN